MVGFSRSWVSRRVGGSLVRRSRQSWAGWLRRLWRQGFQVAEGHPEHADAGDVRNERTVRIPRRNTTGLTRTVLAFRVAVDSAMLAGRDDAIELGRRIGANLLLNRWRPFRDPGFEHLSGVAHVTDGERVESQRHNRHWHWVAGRYRREPQCRRASGAP